MSGLCLTEEYLRAAVLGGGVLGGGGGGALTQGYGAVERILQRGNLELVDISEIDEDALLVTCAEVGAPSAAVGMVEAEDYVRPVELLRDVGRIEIGGLIACECGANASLLGMFPAVCLGIPLVDAPCDGRAHPTGLMGSMGLHTQKDYLSLQAAAGGKKQTGKRLEIFVKSGLDCASGLVRKASMEAGGMVAVARNPVACSFVKRHGAPGAIRRCIELGKTMQQAQKQGGMAVAEAAARSLGGEVLASGEVRLVELACRSGFDSGKVFVEGCEMTFWNEYMTLDLAGKRRGTFPDLIMTLDLNTGNPLTSAELRLGQQLAVLHVPAVALILGDGVRYPALLKVAEQVVERPLLSFIDPNLLAAE